MRFRYALGWLRTTSLAPEERVLWPQGFDRQLSVRQKWPPRSCLAGGAPVCCRMVNVQVVGNVTSDAYMGIRIPAR
jgi:hypothetical protein